MCRTFGPNIIPPEEIQRHERGVDPQRIRNMCRTFVSNFIILFNAQSEQQTYHLHSIHMHNYTNFICCVARAQYSEFYGTSQARRQRARLSCLSRLSRLSSLVARLPHL
eukprot:TRINITY_DN1848_c0_g1_i1.p2 TRINITY_DN1848_c0_g1~~TRINITY_DN1848_c0_g1_i1.p2  ORF type:complete len:109 (+),score=7.69 TRINITY_DN1848_c0_g1_i1:553-879(+)